MKDLIEKFKKLLGDATPGKWIADSGSAPLGDTGDYESYWAVRVARPSNNFIIRFDSSEEENDGNMGLVVGLHNLFPHLLTLIEAQQAEIEAHREYWATEGNSAGVSEKMRLATDAARAALIEAAKEHNS